MADLDALAELREPSPNTLELVKGFLDCFGGDQIGELEDRYIGTYDDERDFAYEWVNEMHDLEAMMGALSIYFDYEAWARNEFINSFTSANVSGGIAVFRNYKPRNR